MWLGTEHVIRASELAMQELHASCMHSQLFQWACRIALTCHYSPRFRRCSDLSIFCGLVLVILMCCYIASVVSRCRYQSSSKSLL